MVLHGEADHLGFVLGVAEPLHVEARDNFVVLVIEIKMAGFDFIADLDVI